MSIAEKAFLGSLMKAEYLLKDTVVQPEHLESTRHKDLMRRMVELNRAGKNVDLISLTTLPDLDSFGGMSYLKMKAKEFVFIFAKNELEAIQFYIQTFQHSPLNCHEYFLDFQLARGNGVISFREMRKEFEIFPAIVVYFKR